MNYGPLEFAAHLARKGDSDEDSAVVRAARDAAPDTRPANRLTVMSGITSVKRVARAAKVEAVSVYEAVAVHSPRIPRPRGSVKVLVRENSRPIVLVLSSHQAVHWELVLEPGATLRMNPHTRKMESATEKATAKVNAHTGKMELSED